MAKVLISYYRSDEISAGTTLCFYESLFRELTRCGNDVLAINMAHYGIFNPNITDNKCFENYLLGKAVEFQPDVIIAFNHHILRSILNKLDVPVVIYDGDELRFFADLDIIKRDISRYKVFSIVKDWRKTYLDFGFQDNQVFYMPPGTAVRTDKKISQDKNISFLGQRRYFLDNKIFEYISKGENVQYLKNLYMDFLKTKDYHYADLFRKNVEEKCGMHLEDSELWPLFDQSYLIFANLLDLGLHLGGHEGAWCDIAPFVPQIAVAHDRSRVFNLDENENFYNSSLLSLCPMHPQAQGQGFSWRCYDIMASNACLVSSTTSELKEQTRGWVDLPMFDTPAEAREICQTLLKDDKRRLQLVAQSNEFIEQNGRWELRFAEMEQILGLTLINKQRQGTFCKLTEHPVWLEDKLHKRTVAGGMDTATVPVQQQSPSYKKDLRRWKLKMLLEKIHHKCGNTTLLAFLGVGEITALAVCAMAQLGLFVVCIGPMLSEVLAWISAMGALAFFVALWTCFFFKFVYKGLSWIRKKVKRH